MPALIWTETECDVAERCSLKPEDRAVDSLFDIGAWIRLVKEKGEDARAFARDGAGHFVVASGGWLQGELYRARGGTNLPK